MINGIELDDVVVSITFDFEFNEDNVLTKVIARDKRNKSSLHELVDALNQDPDVTELVKDHWDCWFNNTTDYYGDKNHFGLGSLQIYEYGQVYSLIADSKGTRLEVTH